MIIENSVNNNINLWKGKPVKHLTLKKFSLSGRNNQGRITVFHRSGGFATNRYRIIDFRRIIKLIPAKVIRFEYDPNRSSFLALILYSNGILSYILATQKMILGTNVVSANNISLTSSINEGSHLPLYLISVGTLISQIELYPGKGSQVCRSAGMFGKLLKKDFNYVFIQISNTLRIIKVRSSCFAVIGCVSNQTHLYKKVKNAGSNRLKGIRPTVRGVAMNPVDHPHGGGEGKTSGGRCSVSPWGKLTKGKPTVKKKNYFLRNNLKF